MSEVPIEISSLMNKVDMNIEQKIVEELVNQKNLDTKTELGKPINWACLSLIKDYLKSKNLPKSAEIIDNFLEIAFKYLISKDRKGRLEYLEALKGLKEKNEIINPMSMAGQIK